ncbi:MAG: DUF4097 domain-containing protein [Thermoanaerobaculia bacterium]|nr:DUF4097 domain-containing protein [Thermoanaerobaculia bacterium]
MKNLMIAAALLAAGMATSAFAQTQEKTFDVGPGQTLEVDLESGGAITITGVDGNSVTVKTTKKGRNASDLEVRVEQSKRGVRIETSHEKARRNWSGGVDVEVTVPRRFNADLETMGGAIRIDGVEGELEGSTMGGALDLKNLKGKLKLSTMGGSVTLASSDVDGEVSTMGGDVVFRDVKGDVKGSSMGGDVRYENVTRADGGAVSKPVEISTMGGDITVASAPAGASVKTMGGDIHIASAKQHVKATTMGGDIEIAAVDGGATASTMGGDVEVTMIGDPSSGKRDVELESMGGDITLTVPAALSMDVEIEIKYTKNSSRNYKIVSDFPLSISESPEWQYKSGGARKIIDGKGVVGGGKNKVVIRTTNGDVRLIKAK